MNSAADRSSSPIASSAAAHAAPHRRHQGHRERGILTGRAQRTVQFGEDLTWLPLLDPLLRRTHHRHQPQQRIARRTGGLQRALPVMLGGRTPAVRGRHGRRRGAGHHHGVRITAALQRAHGAPDEALSLPQRASRAVGGGGPGRRRDLLGCVQPGRGQAPVGGHGPFRFAQQLEERDQQRPSSPRCPRNRCATVVHRASSRSGNR
ncbi:hypothetical protein ACQ4WX_03325 [Streptomyces lasalocidi]